MKNPRSPVRMRAPRPSASRRQSGFTLIEVLVALIVLVLGVLGSAAMTLSAIRDTKQASLRTQATGLAYELADIMRVSGPAQVTTFTGNAPASVASCWTTGCSEADMAKNEFYEWKQKVEGTNSVLPHGLSKVCRDTVNLNDFTTCDNAAASPLVVKIQWDEKSNVGDPNAVTSRLLTVPLSVNY